MLTLATALTAQAQQAPTAQASAEQVPEQILVTGSLIHGTQAVGVPVTSLTDQDFKVTGALTTSDLLKNVPSILAQASSTVTLNGGFITGQQDVEIHGLSQIAEIKVVARAEIDALIGQPADIPVRKILDKRNLDKRNIAWKDLRRRCRQSRRRRDHLRKPRSVAQDIRSSRIRIVKAAKDAQALNRD